MKNLTQSLGLGTASCLLAAFISFGLVGQASAGAPPTPADTTVVDNPVADSIQQAYELLSISDRDYKGYRVKAMKQIVDAANALGVSVTGGTFKHLKQATSDENLTTAQGLLQTLINGEVSGAAMNNLITAVEDLDFALMDN